MFLFFLIFCFYCLCYQSPLHFSLCPPPPSPTHSSVHPHIIVPVHESWINVLWLIPSPLNPILLPSRPTTSVPYIYASVSISFISLLCSYIPQIIEIMWYLFFTDGLISLRIIFSRSIHAVAKSKSSFFFTAAQYSIL